MTPNEINKAIAESVGWMAHPTVRNVWRTPEQCKRNKRLIGTVSGPWSTECSGPPNYYRDLNACAEFEASLTTHNEVHAYRTHLRFNVSATAPQRCEAYLRVMDLWRGQ